MIRLTALLFALSLAPALAAGDYDDLPPDLAKAALAFDRAQVAGDGKALKALLADNYKLVNSANKVEDKAQFIADYTDPDFRLLPFTLKAPVHVVWEVGAVLSAEVDYRFLQKGKPGGVYFRFADIWAKRQGHWQVVYTGVTKLPKP